MANPYYYANKKRVSLEPTDDFFALDVRELREEPDKELRATVEGVGQHLRRGYYLLRPGQLSAADTAQLKERDLIRQVFRHGAHLIVVLPQIQMHESRGEVVSGLREWLGKQTERSEIEQEMGGQITLRAGSTAEALSLANKIYEQLGPQVVEPRMIQLHDQSMNSTPSDTSDPPKTPRSE